MLKILPVKPNFILRSQIFAKLTSLRPIHIAYTTPQLW